MHLGAETDVKQVIEKKSHKERLISSTALPLNYYTYTQTYE